MPKHCWRVVAAWLWLLAAGIPIWAAPKPHFTVDVWDTEKGLPEMSVIALTQTRDGYLWVGAGDGLARFDGVHFKRYEENDALGLSGSKIIRLFEDRRRNLWVGTESAGVFMLSPDGKVASVNPGEASNESKLVNICEDPLGGVWFRMASGNVYRYADGKIQRILSNCTALLVEDSGIVWVGAPDGRLFGLGPVSNSVPGAAVFPIPYELPAGKLDYLVASKGGGYWRLANRRIQKWKVDHLERDFGAYPWRDVPILAACEDQAGNLVVGTFGDGVWWMGTDGQLTRVDGLPHSYIWSLFMDHEGSLWVGSNGGGLNRVKLQSFEVLEGTEGWTVQSVCDDRKGGLWIGYNFERVDHWTSGHVQQFVNFCPPVRKLAPAVNQPEVTRFYARAVFQDAAGQVWAGGGSEESEARPPTLYWLQNGRLTPGPNQEAGEVSAIYQDRSGILWLGGQRGLARWDGKRWKLFTTGDGLSANSVRALSEDADGNLWVGTERGGLNRFRDGKFKAFRRQKDGLPSDNVSSLYVDSQGVLWVGTSSGLARLERGQWTRYTTSEGLASNKIGYLLEDGQGYLWIGSNAGLMRVAKRSLNDYAQHPGGSVECRVFGISDGLKTSECTSGSQPGACRAADGTLYFPTLRGLVVLNPARLRPNTNPPPIAIEAVRIDDQLLNADTPMYAPPPKAITVPAGTESLEISFSSLNLSAPEKGFFKYTMGGYEKTWTRRPGNLRSARYSNLPHGHYTFHVQACNEDGVWNEAGASLSITVLPPFWQTWWFVSASTLCLLVMIVASVHYVSTQKLQRQLAALRQQEALEKERARIARDLHDQLGANLTQVALLGEMAETDKDMPAEVESHAKQISQTARETTRSLDEIVWTVNPSNDTLDGLINYVCKYAQEYFAVANLRYRLEVPPQLPAIPISPELRHNLFLAAKEAINNVVKHSRATAAWLRLQLHPDRFVLEIEDNGSGLPAGAENKGRNGLRNMRKRMEDVGGQFEISPGGEGGTRVRLTAPLGM